MAKSTPAGRLRGPGAAGGADPGTPNTLAVETLAARPHLHVRALPEHGFRRAGRFWPPGAGVTVLAADFTDEQIEQLLSERQLAVTPIWHETAE